MRPEVLDLVAAFGKLVFEEENLFTRFLHNQTAYSIQRILQFRGIPTIILPIRVMKTGA